MTITQVISTLPPAPDPASDPPAVFSQKAAASVLAQRGLPDELNSFGTQANATAAQVNADAATASTAAAAASSAAAIVDADAWVSGQAYAKNECAISQVNFQTYRRKVAGSGTTDPAQDSPNWESISTSLASLHAIALLF